MDDSAGESRGSAARGQSFDGAGWSMGAEITGGDTGCAIARASVRGGPAHQKPQQYAALELRLRYDESLHPACRSDDGRLSAATTGGPLSPVVCELQRHPRREAGELFALQSDGRR